MFLHVSFVVPDFFLYNFCSGIGMVGHFPTLWCDKHFSQFSDKSNPQICGVSPRGTKCVASSLINCQPYQIVSGHFSPTRVSRQLMSKSVSCIFIFSNLNVTESPNHAGADSGFSSKAPKSKKLEVWPCCGGGAWGGEHFFPRHSLPRIFCANHCCGSFISFHRFHPCSNTASGVTIFLNKKVICFL